MHIYQLQDDNIKLLKEVDTIGKMRKATGNLAVSITTKLGIAPNPFLDRWRMQKIYELTKAHPELSFDVIERQSWGVRRDIDGTVVLSSIFGTRVHAELETAVLHLMRGDDYDSEYKQYYRPFLKWMEENNAFPTEAEHMVFDPNLKIAGTMDLVSRVDDKLCVFDFKTRDCKGADPKSKTYPKDAWQLAIGADIIRKQTGLPYQMPIYSVVIDVTTGQTGVKKWTDKAQEKALKKALATNHYYNVMNDL